MEERKSVLETTKPADALGRLASRQHRSPVLWALVVAAVIAVLALVLLIAGNTIESSNSIRAPAVES